MKILEIAPLWEPVPPIAYGGTEAVVALLVEQLVRQGHDVTLWASGDSRTSARLRSCTPVSLRTATGIPFKNLHTCQHAALALKEGRDFDIVHNHAGEDVMAISHLLPDVPVLTTMHCLITDDTKFIWDLYEHHYNCISWSQRRLMPETGGRFAGVVYNGIDISSFPFQMDKDGDLLFLSRISPEKGPHLAIEVARRTGRRLVMAGKVDDKDRSFYREVVEPLVDGERVLFLGEADWKMKRELYQSASCVLMPITWDEPFGLVMPEAMACGTPVIVFNRGAAGEIVAHGETGFVVNGVDEMAAAVDQVRWIDPAYCREYVHRRFDASVMAERYVELYESVLDHTAAAVLPSSASGEKTPLSPTRVA